jgi:hypothetical protein
MFFAMFLLHNFFSFNLLFLALKLNFFYIFLKSAILWRIMRFMIFNLTEWMDAGDG